MLIHDCADADVNIVHLWIACIMDHPYQLSLPKILEQESVCDQSALPHKDPCQSLR